MTWEWETDMTELEGKITFDHYLNQQEFLYAPKMQCKFWVHKDYKKIIVIIGVLKGYLEKYLIVFSDFLNFGYTFQFRDTFILKCTLISEIFNYRYENLNYLIDMKK